MKRSAGVMSGVFELRAIGGCELPTVGLFARNLRGGEVELLRVIGARPGPTDADWIESLIRPLLGGKSWAGDSKAMWRNVGTAFGLRYGVRTPLASLGAWHSSSGERWGFLEGYEGGRKYARTMGIRAVL